MFISKQTEIQSYAIMLCSTGEVLAVSFSSFGKALAYGNKLSYTLGVDYRIIPN
jgi:hypothetical protein